ncbi:MAG: hypothetical protein ABDH18_04575 [Aquificaceae bacterium]
MEIIKLHAAVVHFGIAIPFGLLFMEIFYRVSKRQIDGLYIGFSLLASISVILSTLSGIISYEPIEDKLYQIPIFETHKILGLFTAGVFALLGLLAVLKKHSFLSAVLVFGCILLLIQGWLGGSVVYDHMVKPWIKAPINPS